MSNDVIPFRVGLTPEKTAEEPVVLKDVRPERERKRSDPKLFVIGGGDGPITPKNSEPEKPKLILAGSPNGKTFDEEPQILDSKGEPVSSLTWDSFLAWRKTKCRPYDYENGPKQASPAAAQPKTMKEMVARTTPTGRALEEIDQATHELVGEVAELGQLLLTSGFAAFVGEDRKKLIDECGDILFCAAWAFDAWGKNPLYGSDGLEFVVAQPGSDLAVLSGVLASDAPQAKAAMQDPRFGSAFQTVVLNLMLSMQTCAGLTSNAFKKLKFQRREQDVEAQATRLSGVLFTVNQILILANSTVEEALKVNQRKLDARYPNGYQPGQGGGIRTGEGK